MQSLAQQIVCFFEKGATKKHGRRDSVTAGLLLRVAHRDHHLGSGMLDHEFGDNLGTIICDGSIAVGLVQHLVKATRPQCWLEQVGEHPCCNNQLLLYLGTACDRGLWVDYDHWRFARALTHGFGRP